MKRYSSPLLALMLTTLLLFGPIAPVFAQNLGQVFEWSEIGLTMSYPDGWTEAEIDTQTRVLLSDPAIDMNSDETPNAPVVVMLAFPMAEVGAMGSPQDLLSMFAGEFGEETSMMEDITVGGLPALRVSAEPEEGFSAIIVLVTSDAYAYILGGIAPTSAAFGPLFDSMIATVAISAPSGAVAPTTDPVPSNLPNMTSIGGIVAITIDQARAAGGWSEIDAVELVGLDASGTEVRQWATDAFATSQYGEDAWSARQAIGAPDTRQCGDSSTAWAAASATGVHTITLYYSMAVTPTQINIYETYNPGAVFDVQYIAGDGSDTQTVFSGADPTSECPGVFSIPVEAGPVTVQPVPADATLFHTVQVALDQAITNNWNEIDAVELVGVDANGAEIRQWATSANASSEYSPDSWSARQATGAPDTPDCGDRTTAWASATSTGLDVLTLTYAVPVSPTEINVHQTYNPGAIVAVLLLPDDITQGVAVYEGPDTTTACPGVLTIPVDLSTATPLTSGMSYGSAVTGTLNNTTFTQDWAFDGSAGDVVTITMLNTGGDLDPYLYLLDANGSELASNDDAADTSLGTWNSQIAGYTLPAAGTYTIRASRFGDQYGSSTGSYSLSLDSAGASAPVSATDTTLSYGQTADGIITDASPSQPWVFSGNAGDVVTITMQGTSPLDAYLLLKNASGQELAFNDDAGSPTLGISDAQILNFVLPAAGQYTIEATRFSGNGAYTLTLATGAAPVASAAQPITYGSTVTGTISDQAYRAEWTFTAVRGDVVTITLVAAAGSSLDPYLSLLGPDGAEVASNDDAADTTVGGYNAQIAKYVVQTDGTYTIVATRFGENLGSGSGSYDLSIRLGK
jgi:hypothetical protein